ncbi:hypothetical protein OWR29_01595 [Actinoplanes sp. Pm04-4]|uniref:Uncharacterized protein n=1 Tax=Paractinoplanes pyxinae TaxID=2997416 RepID=A0ABT4ASI1_9ACTN|nr:hypothetical protein [Actinoplanes pyxinae]MCY1136675.1 hypothetical protein [Actinoplanes pyxinae]
MELTPEENQLLVAGLQAVGNSVKRGAGQGASFAARRMRADIFETEVELPLSLPAAAELVGLALDALGTRTAESQAVMGSGAMNLNPAVVTVTLREQDDTVVATVRGVAKEGLIPQRAGRKAARRVAEQLLGDLDS